MTLFFYLLQYAGCAGGQIELEPSLVVASQALVIYGVVGHLVIVEAIAAKVGIVGIEDILVGTLFHHEAVAGIGIVWAEIEEEVQVATTEGKYLVTIVVPYLYDILLFEASVLLEYLKH